MFKASGRLRSCLPLHSNAHCRPVRFLSIVDKQNFKSVSDVVTKFEERGPVPSEESKWDSFLSAIKTTNPRLRRGNQQDLTLQTKKDIGAPEQPSVSSTKIINQRSSINDIQNTLLQIESKEELKEFLDLIEKIQVPVFKDCPFIQFLLSSRKDDFHVSNNLWIRHRKVCTRDIEQSQVDWVYLYLFRFNDNIVHIPNFNLQWIKISEHFPDLILIYMLSYLHSLVNVGQKELAINYFLDWVKDKRIDVQHFPINKLIEILVSEKDHEILPNVLHELKAKKIASIDDMTWVKILAYGLRNSIYKLVLIAYRDYIMRQYPTGKIHAEDVILNQKVSNDSVLNSMSNKFLLDILQCFSVNGDVELTMDLIESHFFHRLLTGGTKMNKDLCVRIIESYCYRLEVQRRQNKQKISFEDMQKLIVMIDQFVKNNLEANLPLINAQDLSLPMSILFGGSNSQHSKKLLTRIDIDRYLAVADNLDINNITKDIYMDCLFDFMMKNRTHQKTFLVVAICKAAWNQVTHP